MVQEVGAGRLSAPRRQGVGETKGSARRCGWDDGGDSAPRLDAGVAACNSRGERVGRETAVGQGRGADFMVLPGHEVRAIGRRPPGMRSCIIGVESAARSVRARDVDGVGLVKALESRRGLSLPTRSDGPEAKAEAESSHFGFDVERRGRLRPASGFRSRAVKLAAGGMLAGVSVTVDGAVRRAGGGGREGPLMEQLDPAATTFRNCSLRVKPRWPRCW